MEVLNIKEWVQTKTLQFEWLCRYDSVVRIKDKKIFTLQDKVYFKNGSDDLYMILNFAPNMINLTLTYSPYVSVIHTSLDKVDKVESK